MRDFLEDLHEAQKAYDPVKAAQVAMRPDLPKRFYKEASAAQGEGGWLVQLDGRNVRTPGKAVLALPTAALARLIADEFSAQGERINPMAMPVLRMCNAAIDGVAGNLAAVVDDIIAYAGSDLLCYRAAEPARLVERQSRAWDGVLAHHQKAHGARFVLAEGVMPVAQPQAALDAVAAALRARLGDPFRAAAAHVITTTSGSALLTLAHLDGALDQDALWIASTVDEAWNAELWGADAEAERVLAARERDVRAACAILAAIELG